MIAVLTPTEMSHAEQVAIANGSSVEMMMKKAGFAVARAAVELAGGVYNKRFVIVCGKGNNAGDGFVAAKYLYDWGAYPVIVHPLEGLSGPLQGPAQQAMHSAKNIKTMSSVDARFADEILRADVIIDAIVGTGFKGAFEAASAKLIDVIGDASKPVLSIDVPSGVNPLTGSAQVAVEATLTIAMGAAKTGTITGAGARRAGRVIVADIGCDVGAVHASVHQVEAADVARMIPKRDASSHKRSVGKVLVVAGSAAMPGAAILAARGAFRAGAGLVRIAVPGAAASVVRSSVIEGLTFSVGDDDAEWFTPDHVDQVMQWSDQVDAIALGPGLGRERETLAFVDALVRRCGKPMVIDADGIFAIAAGPGALKSRQAGTLLTPHSGEMAHLLASEPSSVDADRIENARHAADMTGAVVVFKGSHSVIADPSGDVVVSTTGGPELATAGTGDVLTGISVAMLAAGLETMHAGWTSAWL
ncbi:MAG: NAD(P)H-hydrate dehydratase, partial [Actinobacteria bacterium]|nr:NAD(P)H-hydrate dehydratase [Actinomycetota bacterium]